MTRTELFRLVWGEPVLKVATRFGMSDRGFSKLCARHNIPLPERGYWARVRAGQYPARMQLPQPENDYEIPLKGPVEAVQGNGAALDLQSTMRKLFMGTQKAEEVAQTQPGTADPVVEEVTAAQHVPLPGATQAAWAMDAECQRAMAAGMEYQQRQAAQAFLGAVVANAYRLDEQTCRAVLAWARGVHDGLSLADPVVAVINEIRASSGGAAPRKYGKP